MPDWASPQWTASKVQPNPEVIQIWGRGPTIDHFLRYREQCLLCRSMQDGDKQQW